MISIRLYWLIGFCVKGKGLYVLADGFDLRTVDVHGDDRIDDQRVLGGYDIPNLHRDL